LRTTDSPHRSLWRSAGGSAAISYLKFEIAEPVSSKARDLAPRNGRKGVFRNLQLRMKEIIKKFTPPFLINWYHFGLAMLGSFLYSFPSKKIKVIGVTGTQGKTTVVDLTKKILEEAGHKVASLSSIKFKIREKEWINALKMTMPGRFGIQRFLRKALDSGCRYAILEVTSEGILQHRQRFIDFDIAVFTNLSKEHIERHGSFENYKRAKGKLFKQVKKIHILNLNDKNVDYFSQFLAEKKIGFAAGSERLATGSRDFKIIRAENCQEGTNGASFTVDDTKFNLKLFGKFNVYNALAAICVGLSQEINLETCKKALEKIKEIPGRMEVVINDPFEVIVDYAHTPDSLIKVYETLNYLKPKTLSSQISKKLGRTSQKPKLVCVIGSAGGGRDRWKRSEIGKIAARYCDEIIITNEDPYDENPNQILSEIKSGISNIQYPISNIHEILDRRKAIKKALSLAKPNDTVIITGKGCEPWMCVAGGRKIPWDDRKIVREEFKNL